MYAYNKIPTKLMYIVIKDYSVNNLLSSLITVLSI